MLKDKKILIAVTGGIAAYKVITLCSMLKKRGAEIKVMLSENAQKFVTPLPFSTLTGNEVLSTLWKDNGDIPHIDAADWADIIVIAPATGNIIAKISMGIADDLISSTLLARTSPVLIVPAMNVHMLNNPATQANMELLKERGFFFMESEYGNLACGYEAKGRYPENEEIIYHIDSHINYKNDFAGKKIMITAGACRENIDPMRFISNRSTGKMGLALARAAHIRGAKVSLIAAHIKERIPEYINLIKAESAEEMHKACIENSKGQDVIIMNAAVSDYTPKEYTVQKIKKNDNISLDLIRTKDIISELSKNREPGQIICGFAAESENIINYARSKMIKKNMNCIVANDLRNAGKNNTECIFIDDSREITLKGSKFEVSQMILEHLKEFI